MNKFRKWVLLAIPGFLGFGLLYVAPFFESSYYSLLKDVFSKTFVWFENYKKVLTNEYFLLATRNTIVFLVAGSTSVMIIAVFMSYFLMCFFDNSHIVKGILLIPFLIPSSAVMGAWKEVFDSVFFSYKIPDSGLGVFIAEVPILTIFIWKTCGLMILIINTAMNSVPEEVIEASRLDGAGILKRLSRIILPIIRPNLFFCACSHDDGESGDLQGKLFVL